MEGDRMAQKVNGVILEPELLVNILHGLFLQINILPSCFIVWVYCLHKFEHICYSLLFEKAH
jgi:hypothetical protein